jgi:hypothetical protein
MATKITVALEDDLNGGPASETVRFGLGNAQYEIDLNKKNARTFRKKLTPFVEHARKAGPGQRRGPARTASSRQCSADIRAWPKPRAFRSATAGASPPALPASTKPPPEDPYARPLTIGMNQSLRRSLAAAGQSTASRWSLPAARPFLAARISSDLEAVGGSRPASPHHSYLLRALRRA